MDAGSGGEATAGDAVVVIDDEQLPASVGIDAAEGGGRDARADDSAAGFVVGVISYVVPAPGEPGGCR